ncbi:LysR family transcriptional regulator [Croceibacterium aestuarii]|uniref:LysR family transcriptional regulator n=1 Tax=Croceibacterium aestuarii TaxID=3064139 RepID=UPI00272DFF95|nr:LysR family transcriptional regulator [Croceibacterium sp. D39]
MPSLPFTLRQLEVFASLCATRSFRRTAEALGISQASVSNQIKALEDQLGLSLLSRRPGKRPSLTQDGMSFLEDLRDFNSAGERLASHRRSQPDRDGPVVYRIRVGQGLVDYFIKPKLDRFLSQNPNIELEFEAQPPSYRYAQDIQDARFDFALFHLRADRPVDPVMRQLAMVRGGIFGHRRFLKGRNSPLSADEMSQLPFVLPQAGSLQEREVLKAFEVHGIVPRKVVSHTQFFDVIGTMLERGHGVASFSEVMLAPEARTDVILLYPLQDWRLIWYRQDHSGDPRCDIVESFMLSSVLQDPDYPTIDVFAGEYAG